jgi:hypothetical protein
MRNRREDESPLFEKEPVAYLFSEMDRTLLAKDVTLAIRIIDLIRKMVLCEWLVSASTRRHTQLGEDAQLTSQ